MKRLGAFDCWYLFRRFDVGLFLLLFSAGLYVCRIGCEASWYKIGIQWDRKVSDSLAKLSGPIHTFTYIYIHAARAS